MSELIESLSIDPLLEELLSDEMDFDTEIEIKNQIMKFGEDAVPPTLDYINKSDHWKHISNFEDILLGIGEVGVPYIIERMTKGIEEHKLSDVLRKMDVTIIPYIMEKLTDLVYKVDDFRFNKGTGEFLNLLEYFDEATVEYMIKKLKEDILSKDKDCIEQVIREFDSHEPLLKLMDADLNDEIVSEIQNILAKKYSISDSIMSYLESTSNPKAHINAVKIIDCMRYKPDNVNLVEVLKAAYHENQSKTESGYLYDLDEITWKELETGLMTLYEAMGYSVEPTPETADYGGDFIATKPGCERLAVQVKKSATTTAINAIQEALGAKNYYLCSDAVVISTNNFSTHAQNLAQSCGIRLINRRKLQWLVEKYNLG